MLGEEIKVATLTLYEDHHILLCTSQASENHFRAVLVVDKQKNKG